MGELEPQRIQPHIVGAVEATSVAYAFDLDLEHVTYAGNHLCLSNPKAHVECVTPDCLLPNNYGSLRLRNNGSIHMFERSILSVTPLVRAIQESQLWRRPGSSLTGA
jgi:hypothetical protein